MKQYSDTTSMELSFSEISKIIVTLVLHTEKHIKLNSPVVIIENYVTIIRKFNDVLKENGFDYYTDKKFQEFEMYICSRKGGEPIEVQCGQDD